MAKNLRGFGNFSSFDSLDANPLTLDLSAGQNYTNSLHIWPKFPLGNLDHVRSDTPALFGLPPAMNNIATNWPLSCN
jgi:hypothetical protein